MDGSRAACVRHFVGTRSARVQDPFGCHLASGRQTFQRLTLRRFATNSNSVEWILVRPTPSPPTPVLLVPIIDFLSLMTSRRGSLMLRPVLGRHREPRDHNSDASSLRIPCPLSESLFPSSIPTCPRCWMTSSSILVAAFSLPSLIRSLIASGSYRG